MNFKYLAQLAVQYNLVLGSSSPRRQQLLRELGLQFRIVKPHIDETPPDHLPPFEVAKLLAELKTAEVIRSCRPGDVVMGCDTIVVLKDQILNKPEDQSDAFRILSLLSGREHQVCTAVALQSVEGVMLSGYETTAVTFNQVNDEQLWNYIDSGEPMDKAGAYGIQGMGGFLVDTISGNLDNVIGLPRSLADRLAQKILLER